MGSRKETDMIPLTSDKEYLIQWACKIGRISERELRKQWGGLDVFCAKHPVGLATLLDRVIKCRNKGYSLWRSIRAAKKEWE